MLAGSLSEFSIPDIFTLLAGTKKTGALRITGGAADGRVWFAGGQVVFAVADVKRAPLAARLVHAGLADVDQVAELVQAHGDAGSGRIAELLRTGFALDDETLETFLQDQVTDACFELMRLEEGRFSFDADTSEVTGPTFPAEEIIDAAGLRLAEWQVVLADIPSTDAVLCLAPAPPTDQTEISVPIDEWAVLTLVDGRRTVADIVSLTGQGRFATCQRLASLVRAGAVTASPEGSGSPSGLQERRDALRRLEAQALSAPAVDTAPVARRDPSFAGDEPLAGGVTEPTPVEPAEPVGERRADPVAGAEPRPAAAVDEHVIEHHDASGDVFGGWSPGGGTHDDAHEDVVGLDADEVADLLDFETSPVESLAQAARATPIDAGDDRDVLGPSPNHLDTVDAAGQEHEWGSEARQPNGPEQDPGAGSHDDHRLDRVQVARELASLGLADGAPDDDDSAEPAPPVPSTELRRDEEVNKSLLYRLIDGVKGA